MRRTGLFISLFIALVFGSGCSLINLAESDQVALDSLREAGVKKLDVLYVNDLDQGPYISSTLNIDPTSNELEALVDALEHFALLAFRDAQRGQQPPLIFIPFGLPVFKQDLYLRVVSGCKMNALNRPVGFRQGFQRN